MQVKRIMLAECDGESICEKLEKISYVQGTSPRGLEDEKGVRRGIGR